MSAFVGELDRIQTAEEASSSDVGSWFNELRTAVISLGAAEQPSNHCASVLVHASRCPAKTDQIHDNFRRFLSVDLQGARTNKNRRQV